MTKPNLRSDDFDEFCEAWRLADQAERATYAQILAETPRDELTEVERLKLDTIEVLTAPQADDDDEDVDQDAPPPPAVARPFPVASLPEWAREFVTELAEQHQTPVDLPALVALGAISAVANRIRATLKINSTWVEGPNLYLAISLPPGAGKSPVMKALLGPVAGIEADEVKKARRAMHEIAADVVSIEKRLKVLKTQLEGTEDPGPKLKEDYADTLGDLADAEARIDDGRILADDVTPEALGKLLHRNAGTISLISTEARRPTSTHCSRYGAATRSRSTGSGATPSTSIAHAPPSALLCSRLSSPRSSATTSSWAGAWSPGS
jgi:hypothetical protein